MEDKRYWLGLIAIAIVVIVIPLMVTFFVLKWRRSRLQSVSEGEAGENTQPVSPWTAVAVVVGLAALITVPMLRDHAPDASQMDQLAVNAAVTLLSSHLKAPATAVWGQKQVVAREPPFYGVHLVVDAQNSFGALLRSEYLVAIEVVGSDRFRSDPHNAIFEISPGIPITESEITSLKMANAWPSARRLLETP